MLPKETPRRPQAGFVILALLLLLAACTPAGTPEQSEFTVINHPDGPLYVGDQVSFEVLSVDDVAEGESVSVALADQALGQAFFATFGIGRREQATLWWVWDTTLLDAGEYSLTFTLANGTTWEHAVRLLPAEQLPPPEPGAAWATLLTECCSIHYITGTAAERDLQMLAEMADLHSAEVAVQMGVALVERVPLIFMPRVIGHGGFAWDGVYISYMDDNYVGNEMDMVLHHEFVHYYDDWIGGQYLPAMLQEGLAVYLSGGHFKPEPLLERCAAMVALGWSIPLVTLADDFYAQQHDLGYLEAAALVAYLVETYGEETFFEFYRTFPYPEDESDAEVLDAALQGHYGITLADVELAFNQHLDFLSIPPEVQTDLELTVGYFDAVRDYQALLDPSAYFLTAWLPNGQVMRERGIVADLIRRPTGWKNWLVENMLIRVHTELFSGRYDSAARWLQATEWVLQVLETD